MFCPQCGSTDKIMIKGLCKDCFLKDFQLISIPDKIEVTLCAHCHSNLKEGKWKDLGLPEEEIIYRALEEAVEIEDLVENPAVDLEILKMRGSIAECLIQITGSVLGEKIIQEYHVNVRLNKSVCPDCSKFNAGYYESVIQLRADKRPLTDLEIESADQVVNSTLERMWENNRMAYLAQRAKMKEGIDYYIGSQKSARKVLSALREVLGGVAQESPRLISQDKSTGKGLYRTWISLRLPEFNIGDFIEYEDHIGQVKSMDSRKVVAQNLSTPDSFSVLWKEYDKIESLSKSGNIQTTTITSKSPSEIQILHPETFQPIDLAINENLAVFRIGEEVSVVQIKGKIYLLPQLQSNCR